MMGFGPQAAHVESDRKCRRSPREARWRTGAAGSARVVGSRETGRAFTGGDGPWESSRWWLATILLGIVGSFVGGFLASTLLGRGTGSALEPSGIVGSVIGAGPA